MPFRRTPSRMVAVGKFEINVLKPFTDKKNAKDNEKLDLELNREVRAIAEIEIASGRERGLQIVAYHNGRKIVDICAGSTGEKDAVTPETRFMAYSVAKGVSATIIARAIDKGPAKYTDAVSQHWPAFGARGKENITIAEALGHRAGLRANSLCPLKLFWLVLVGRCADGMSAGIEWIAACTPTWNGTQRARYHPTSWSWIAGGIYKHVATGSTHINDGAAELARTLGMLKEELQLGEIDGRRGPRADARGPIARMVVPRRILPEGFFALPEAARPSVAFRFPRPELDLWSSWIALCVVTICFGYPMLIFSYILYAVMRLAVLAPFYILACIESYVWVLIGNWSAFLSVCLPSSNGVFTARALGAMYGALANGGSLEDGTTVLSAKAMKELRRLIDDPMEDVQGTLPARPARQTCGFSPWMGGMFERRLTSQLHARGSEVCVLHPCPRLPILGHTGMGGCCAYADLEEKLAVVVLKNAFSPELVNGNAPGRTFELIDNKIRAHLFQQSLNEVQTPAAPGRRPQASPARRRR